jgi:hypothetical protein
MSVELDNSKNKINELKDNKKAGESCSIYVGKK